MVTDTGFILSKEAFDSSSGVSFVFWLWCEHGPLKVHVEHQEVVFFIPENQVSAATRLLKSQNIHVRFADAKLRNFQNQSVICCYFKSLKDYYRAIKILKSSHILLFEDDVTMEQVLSKVPRMSWQPQKPIDEHFLFATRNGLITKVFADFVQPFIGGENIRKSAS